MATKIPEKSKETGMNIVHEPRYRAATPFTNDKKHTLTQDRPKTNMKLPKGQRGD
jgi:hypothetical protein